MATIIIKSSIDLLDASANLPELLRQVKSGKRFTITESGVAVADLIPGTSADVNVKRKVIAIEKLKAFMHTNPVRGVNIKTLIREG